MRVALVLETHIHNDYVTGGFELARRTGAGYLVAAADDVEFDRDAVSDGDVRTVGTMTVRAVATPGHTDTHLSYIVERRSRCAGGVHRWLVAVRQRGPHRSGRRGPHRGVDPRAVPLGTPTRAELLADDAAVYPTHGFGSFCSSGSSAGGDASTIGQERARNDALVEPDEDAFVAKLIAGLTAYPSYYAHMGPQPAGSRRG